MAARTFLRGVHPRDEKRWTEERAVEPLALPERLFVPLSQHIGAPARATVKKGDKVLFSKYAGTEINIEGVEHLIIREDDVLGVVE